MTAEAAYAEFPPFSSLVSSEFVSFARIGTDLLIPIGGPTAGNRELHVTVPARDPDALRSPRCCVARARGGGCEFHVVGLEGGA